MIRGWPDRRQNGEGYRKLKVEFDGKHLVKFVRAFSLRVHHDRIDVYAAQASFFIVMSIIPILMLMFTLLKFTPLTQEMVMETMARIMNEETMSTVQEIVDNVYDGSVTVVSFAVISAIWVAGKGIMGLTNGLNRINRLRENRNYFLLRIRASVYTVLMVIALIVAVAILVFGFRFQAYLCVLVPLLKRYQDVMLYLQTFVALCLLTLIFTALYMLLPNGKKPFGSQFPGAVFATVSWCVFSYFFSLYLSYAKNMSVIYGGLATLVVLLLWLYICMYLWFLGAELNVYLENPSGFYLQAARK